MSGFVPSPEAVRRAWGPPATLGAPPDAVAAMDSALEGVGSLIQHSMELGQYVGTAGFLGYSALQSIAQTGLIRACIETVADDMTREWIELHQNGGDGDEDEALDEKIKRIEEEFERLNLRDVFHDAASMTGFYGGCLLFLDTGAFGEDLALPLSLDKWGREAGARGFLKAVRVVDPVNCFPGRYNATDPLRADYYVPQSWYVLGKEVHATRLLRVYANEPPLLFRPSYNFLGIPQAQLLWDYVVHFQDNRDSVNRLLDKFSQLVMKTAMTDLISGGAKDMSNLQTRLAILCQNRSNDGVIAIDKDAEDIVKLDTAISGVTDVVRQSLEIVAALNRTPAVKLLGISPSGFNATGESDLRNYYDHVASQQEKVLRHPLEKVLKAVEASLFGDVDKRIGFDFCPLSEEDENAKMLTQQARINNLCAVLDRDLIDADEARGLLVSDPDSGFDGLPAERPESADTDDLMFAPEALPSGEPEAGGEKPHPAPPSKASPTVPNPALR